MNLQQIVAQKHQSPGGEMLLVRNTDILSTMVRIPIVVIGLVLVALSAPIQQSFGSSRTLDFTIYPDGSTHVFYELDVDPLKLEIMVELFGEMIENITITDEDGFLLSNEINHNSVVIETFGASHISIDYDTQDLVSKTGKIWAFAIDAPVQYSLLTPRDAVIVEMGNFPLGCFGGCGVSPRPMDKPVRCLGEVFWCFSEFPHQQHLCKSKPHHQFPKTQHPLMSKGSKKERLYHPRPSIS